MKTFRTEEAGQITHTEYRFFMHQNEGCERLLFIYLHDGAAALYNQFRLHKVYGYRNFFK